MNCLSIGIEEDIDYIKNIIENETGKHNNKTEFKINHRNDMNIDYLDITVREKKDMNNIKIKVANILSRYIINKYEKNFLEKIISTNYCYFNQGERKEILNTALRNIKAEDEKDVLNNLFFLKRKNIIVRSLIEYFDNSNELILNGFITFRLKEYLKELEEVVDKAVDDFLTEREYREFIRLLKYFVEIQEPKFDIVHVLAEYNGKYSLLDNDENEITNECVQDFKNEVNVGEINYDDLLVSSLITLAPKKIIIHNINRIENKELLETIKNVFPGKLVICEICHLCTETIIKNDNEKTRLTNY